MSNGQRHPAHYKMSHAQAEIEYLRTTVEEQKAIISQLTYGPGEVEYIHPLDLYELFNKDLTQSLSYGMMGASNDAGDIMIGFKRYRQSALIPARTKNIK
jgi:hypothetical protein